MKNYFGYSFYLALATFVLLGAMWFVPATKGDIFSLRKVSILSDLIDDSFMYDAVGLCKVADLDSYEPLPMSCTPYYYTPDPGEESIASDDLVEIPLVEASEEVDQMASNQEVYIAPIPDIPVPKPRTKFNPEIPQQIAIADQPKAQTPAKPVQKTPPAKKETTQPIIDIKPIPTPAKPAQSAQISKPKTTVATTTTTTAKTPVATPKPAESSQPKGDVVRIEGAENAKFQQFLSKLKSGKKVRIAVVGDSFIEGDIFTQDLRELLQLRYGGNGVGYVPITSQVAGFRRSVGHTFSGWTTQSVLNSKSGNYHLAGYVFTPAEGAWVHYKGSSFKTGLAVFNSASMLFINQGRTKITATINDTIVEEFTPPSGSEMQKITVNRSNIKSIRFKVSNVSGFKAYGAVLGGENGVSVDNYSVRSYSGVGLSQIAPAMAAQAERLVHYDLIIIQYGLNVTSANVTKYTNFSQQMVKVVSHLQNIMPSTALLMMSVSDRQSRTSGEWATMPGITAMEQTQRGVAQHCDIPFWSTLKAMQATGGMSHYVKKGWAAKDYTHLASPGGKVVAGKLVQAMIN